MCALHRRRYLRRPRRRGSVPGLAGTVLVRQRPAFTATLAAALPPSASPPATPAPTTLRATESRTLPPDRPEVAHQTTPRRHPRRAPSPARPVPHHLQHPTPAAPSPHAPPPSWDTHPRPALRPPSAVNHRPPHHRPRANAKPATTPSRRHLHNGNTLTVITGTTPTSSSTANSSATSPRPTQRTQPLNAGHGRPTRYREQSPRHEKMPAHNVPSMARCCHTSPAGGRNEPARVTDVIAAGVVAPAARCLDSIRNGFVSESWAGTCGSARGTGAAHDVVGDDHGSRAAGHRRADPRPAMVHPGDAVPQPADHRDGQHDPERRHPVPGPGPRRLEQPAAVDRRRLHPRVRRPAAHRRQLRRPLRPQAGAAHRHRHLRHRLGALRTGRLTAAPHLHPGADGHRRCADHAVDAVDPDQRVP